MYQFRFSLISGWSVDDAGPMIAKGGLLGGYRCDCEVG